jgi:hypothetical protein
MGNFFAGKFKLMDATSIRVGNFYVFFPQKFDPINAGK